MPKVNFDRQRENVVQLLRDRGNDLVTGNTLRDFQEMGAHQGGRMIFTAEYIRRYFGVPKNRDDDAIYTDEYVEHIRGASHVVLEKRLQELRREAPPLWRAVNRVFPRDEGGDRDYERLKKRAAGAGEKVKEDRYDDLKNRDLNDELERRRVSGYETLKKASREQKVQELLHDDHRRVRRANQAKHDLRLCDRGIDVLTLYCQEDDLFVEFARARTVREEGKMEEMHAQIEAEYEDMKSRPGNSEKDAAEIVADRWGISFQSVRRIAESQRLARGEEKREPGRPKKAV